MYNFYIKELDDEYKSKLKRIFDSNINDILDSLVFIYVKYYDFNEKIQEGKLVCNRIVANKLLNIFKKLYKNKYQIDKIKLIDEYNFNDIKSMEDNNTSCFNYRKILNTDKYSKHSYGLAVDINPLYNPYFVKENNKVIIYPKNAIVFADRNKNFDHKIDQNDLCYKLFIQEGFIWGGNWEYPDYQHFEIEK